MSHRFKVATRRKPAVSFAARAITATASGTTRDLRTTADDRAATLARCAELEYDDEYDDSFDELAEVANVGSAGGGIRGSAGVVVRGESDNGWRTKVGQRFERRLWSPGGTRRNDNWIAHGRVYHSKKEGATMIRAGSVEEAAARAARAMKAARREVHGLGAGGNRAAFSRAPRRSRRAAAGEEARGFGGKRGGGRRHGHNRGGGC